MTVLAYLEVSDGTVDDVSLQALALSRSLAVETPLQAVVACDDQSQALSADAGAHGVQTLACVPG